MTNIKKLVDQFLKSYSFLDIHYHVLNTNTDDDLENSYIEIELYENITNYINKYVKLNNDEVVNDVIKYDKETIKVIILEFGTDKTKNIFITEKGIIYNKDQLLNIKLSDDKNSNGGIGWVGYTLDDYLNDTELIHSFNLNRITNQDINKINNNLVESGIKPIETFDLFNERNKVTS
ncbi:hypothetical protein QOK74_08315 [Staphylococcus saprophyticus]|uniref:hypothetical protein n=1 Tax=Staphylococcus saprophyticus TaxID=29385 RepID=UPI0024C42687|nr:hypothetical protein [Staphylococcus saprophyticus]MDK1672875.1 hypothetical protein [Staphylococcus saprophyticus]